MNDRKVTIIRADNTVQIEGKAHWVDCSALPAYVRVIQWDEGKGEMEFVNDGRDTKSFMPNLPFTDFDRIKFLVDGWDEAERLAQARAAADEAAKQDAKAAAKLLV